MTLVLDRRKMNIYKYMNYNLLGLYIFVTTYSACTCIWVMHTCRGIILSDLDLSMFISNRKNASPPYMILGKGLELVFVQRFLASYIPKLQENSRCMPKVPLAEFMAR